MKQMLIRTQNAQPSSSTISFFFNGRGTLLEMKPLGLFRSLLHQLFRQQRHLLESFLPKFRTKRDTLKAGWEWQEGELSDYFSDVIRNAQISPMTVFIDALDECEYESDMRRLVSFFANLSSYAISSNYDFKVCLSSRHYPHIGVAGCEEIFLEMWNSPDILKYVQSELRLEDTTGRSFQGDVMEKASGIFLWVVLVVASLVKERDEGRTVREMRQQLEELPDQLDELFTNYFESVSARDRLETLHLMQWILFAQRPLTAAEVYCALAFCVEPPPRSQKIWQEDCLDNEPQIESRLRTLSKGLVEIKEVHDDWYLWPPQSLRVVQFIHESVRDFLIHRNGLLILDSSLGQLIPGKSHDLLARACINYLSTEEFQTNSMIEKAQVDRLSNIDGKHADRIIMEYEQYTLWDYAVRSMFDHASRAESGGVDQRYLARIFHVRRRKGFDDWRFFHDCLQAARYGNIQGLGTMFLHIASEHGLLSCVHELLSQGVDVNVRGGRHRFALIAAASEGHTAIAQLLLQRGDKAARDERGMTALHWTAREGHVEMLRLLLEEGLDVTAKDQNGMTALHMAVSSGVGEALMVPILNANGADVDSVDKYGRTALHLAADEGHHVIVQLLLNAGACVTVIDKGEKTALHYAAESGNEETVALLLKNGADVAVKDKNGRMVLHGGADRWRENVMIMQLLIAKGADAMAKDKDGVTPLYLAVRKGNEKTTRLLLDCGADATAKDKDGVTPLHLAVESGNEKTTRLLLDCGADATVSTKNKVTVLHQAAGSWKENEVIVRLLIDKGANVAAKDGKGTLALHFAAGCGHLEIVNRLVELEADASAQTKDGWQPIHFAAQGGHLEIVKRLIELKADASAQTKDGWQPIHFAAQRGRLEVINYLVELEVDHQDQGHRISADQSLVY
jgi:ankyrin repeat protein